MLFVFQSCHAQTLDYDLAEACLFPSLSLKREEEFENFQESATRTKIIIMFDQNVVTSKQ